MTIVNESIEEISPSFTQDMNKTTSYETLQSTSKFLHKRQLFWKQIMKHFNFINEKERQQVLLLTQYINWLHMPTISQDYLHRQQIIYSLLYGSTYTRSEFITRDVTRTFSIFKESNYETKTKQDQKSIQEYQEALSRVLNAIGEVENGYCQGMNFVAALFLVENMSEAQAYSLYIYILQQGHLSGLYQLHSTYLNNYLNEFDEIVQCELPRLYTHMEACGFATPMYGVEWFTTMFTVSTKVDLARAILDLYFMGLQDICLRVGLAILQLLEPNLLCMATEELLKNFKVLVYQLDPYHTILKALEYPANINPKVNYEIYKDTAHYLHAIHMKRLQQQTITKSWRSIGKIDLDMDNDDMDNDSRDHTDIALLEIDTDNEDEGNYPIDGSSSQFRHKTNMRVKKYRLRRPQMFARHRTLPPSLSNSIKHGQLNDVVALWKKYQTTDENCSNIGTTLPPLASDQISKVEFLKVLANEVLHQSVYYGQTQIADFAISKCGADVNYQDEWGLFPLHFAVLRNYPDIVRLLLLNDADRHIRLTFNNTVYSLISFARLCKELQWSSVDATLMVLERKVCFRCNVSCGFNLLSFPQGLKFISQGKCKFCRLSFCKYSSGSSSSDKNNECCLTKHTQVCVTRQNRTSRLNKALSDLDFNRSRHDLHRRSNASSCCSNTESEYSSSVSLAPLEILTIGEESVQLLETHKSSSLSSNDEDDDNNTEQHEIVNNEPNTELIEFPPHPRWYCNVPSCHFVFTPVFHYGHECLQCHGWFCEEHFLHSGFMSQICLSCESKSKIGWADDQQSCDEK